MTVVTASGARFRADLVLAKADGHGGWSFRFVEVKTGLAGFTPGQETGYPELVGAGGELRTDKLARFGLKKGDTLQSTPVVVERYKAAACPSDPDSPVIYEGTTAVGASDSKTTSKGGEK
ncbi:MAG: hypothetical protein ACHREM_10980 [Polyangiales bacterium]